MLASRHVVRKAVEPGGHRPHVAGRLHLSLPRLGGGERFSLFWPRGKSAAGFLRNDVRGRPPSCNRAGGREPTVDT